MARGRKARHIEEPDRFMDNTRIRELYLKWCDKWMNYTDDERLSAPGQLCRILGWYEKNGRADTTRPKRRLGLIPDSSNGKLAQSIEIELAEKLVAAMGYDPIDADL